MYILDICQDLSPIINLIKHGLMPVVQIGIPILLIVFGTLDLGKAVIASKEDEVKKAQQMLIKRAIYAVAVFFVTTLVILIFNIIVSSGASKDIEGNPVKWQDCWK